MVSARTGRMRIAYVVGAFPSLSETFVLDQITGLLDRGHEVDVFAERPAVPGAHRETVARYRLQERVSYRPAFGRRELRQLTPLLTAGPARWSLVARSLRARAGRSLRASLRVASAAAAHGSAGPYDVIHAHFGPMGLLALDLRDTGVFTGPLVTTFHGVDMSQFVASHGRNVYRRLFERGELFLPVSQHWADRLVELGCPRGAIRVHRMGIHLSPATERAEPDASRPLRLISVARLVEKKGIDVALRALADLAREGIAFHYRVVGDGPLREKLVSLAGELGLGARVVFEGALPRSAVLERMANSDLLLAPSITATSGDQEGIPVSLMEAMAHGLPVVSTHHSGIPELVEDGVAGVLVPEGDVVALALALRQLVAGDRKRLVEMGRVGRRAVEEAHDLARLNDELERLLRCVAAGGGSLRR